MTIQQAVIKKLKLFSKRKSVNLLDGNYDSIFRGKGIELDSLRPYIFGDNVKDIDWRSTARTGTVHTRLYSPLRDQKIIIVCDTTPSMLINTQTQFSKLDITYGLIVTLGLFVKKNQDLISTCHIDKTGKLYISKFANTDKHIEKQLQNLDSAIHKTPPQLRLSLVELLKKSQYKFKQRSAIFVISDSIPNQEELKPIIKKLSSKHQLFWLQIMPSSPFIKSTNYAKEIVDIESNTSLNKYIAENPTLNKEWIKQLNDSLTAQQNTCKATGSAYGNVSDPNDLTKTLSKMFLDMRRYAKQQ